MSNKNWKGEFVTDELGVEFHGRTEESPLELTSLTGLALRNNPKRSHLLVSKVLGKHYPQNPLIIEKSSEILALMVWEKQQKVGNSLSLEAMGYLDAALQDDHESLVKLTQLLDAADTSMANTVTFGYAETAVSLGAAVAQKLNSYYVHSTRYPDADAVNYGLFEESHSHASSHYLTPSEHGYFNDANNDIVLVDDEITTGNTIKNTIAMLEEAAHHSTYYVVSLVDLRTSQDRDNLASFAADHNVKIVLVALFSGTVVVPSKALEQAQGIIERLKVESPLEQHLPADEAVLELVDVDSFVPKTKNGIKNLKELDGAIDKIVNTAKNYTEGKTLVLGLEEDMYVPLRVASVLREDNENVLFSTTTRSPVLAYDNPGYAIQHKIKFHVPKTPNDTSKRFAYNIDSTFDSVLIVCNSKKEVEALLAKGSLIEKLKPLVRKITIMTTKELPEPLVGPAFGSYSAEDVKWLLKDLSNSEIETAVEEREEAIQSGQAHYAESLPVEYQPTEEYQELFKQALEDSKVEIAQSIGLVSEVILRERNNEPVIVSLARAGTPIGILIKRYLAVAHQVEAPHYAVSIVRGKGIDANALNYLASKYDPSRIIFVDGWTGKGAITRELKEALEEYEAKNGVHFSPEVAVLADPGSCVRIFGTRDDFLIPSACLNSTVSGLISRTVLNETLIGKNDYHGGKFYTEFLDNDYSNVFLDAISELFTESLVQESISAASVFELEEPTWSGWQAIERINKEYGINNINLVKPGVGETTRVLLRRVPWRILIRPDKFNELEHIRLLAESRGVEIEIVENLPYGCVGLIHPQFTKGATGTDGKKAN